MWKCFHFLSTWIFVAPTLLNPRTRLTHQPSAVRMDFIRVWKLARRVRLCFFFRTLHRFQALSAILNRIIFTFFSATCPIWEPRISPRTSFWRHFYFSIQHWKLFGINIVGWFLPISYFRKTHGGHKNIVGYENLACLVANFWSFQCLLTGAVYRSSAMLVRHSAVLFRIALSTEFSFSIKCTRELGFLLYSWILLSDHFHAMWIASW
jgi:hypothetical protein